MSLSLIELKASQPDDVLKSVEVIRRNLERQALLIEDLGDALEMLGGGLGLDLEDADLAELAEKAAKAVSSAAAVDIGWAGSRPGPLEVAADPERLGRAIGTLLETVASGLRSGERIELAAAGSNGRFRLEMRRAGTEPSELGHDPRPRRKRPVMRLTVASEIVEKHGGRLEVEDERAAVELPPR
jgi:signal transduction histidine kinase